VCTADTDVGKNKCGKLQHFFRSLCLNSTASFLSILLEEHITVLFFYFVTCPCSSRTKRHDNLFVDDDDDDDDELWTAVVTS